MTVGSPSASHLLKKKWFRQLLIFLISFLALLKKMLVNVYEEKNLMHALLSIKTTSIKYMSSL